jgi:ribosomal protein S18 acetylase RimI-like enzyme
MAGPTIRRARSQADLAAIARLLREYAASLPIDLDYQGFEREVAHLPGPYAPPRGDMFLALHAGKPVGCVLLKPLEGLGICEMKRLYLAPEARGSGLGKRLAEIALKQARSNGFGEMRLDTLSSMRGAIALYERLGFRLIDRYYASAPPETIFMARKL